MTYNQLAKWISNLTETQRECDVSVFSSETEEYYPLEGVFCEEDDDVLDKDHPVLEI